MSCTSFRVVLLSNLLLALVLTLGCRPAKPEPAARARASTALAATSAAPSASSLLPDESCRLPPEAERALRELGAIPLRMPLTDYGQTRATSSCYFAVSPENEDAVARVVRVARELRLPIRVRGRAHSANGSSLPAERELLLSTNRLNELAFERPGSVDAGAGIAVQSIDGALRGLGFSLPVINDGAAGPTLGGYISAAGMGSGSREHGGLWANVESIVLVTGTGEIRRIQAKDPDFLWVFGAMGQLGVIVAARLVIVPAGSARDYPLGQRRRVDSGSNDVRRALGNGPNTQERLRWFTLLTKPERKAEARRALEALVERHGSALGFRAIYEYAFRQTGSVPPLFFDQGPALVALGVWGDMKPGTSPETLVALERDFMDLIRSGGYRRYIQSETPSGPGLYESYFGARLYGEFRERKLRYDPDQLLNRGAVFAVAPGH
ncbi:MAG TPA: FAD-binding oxidoreductase [Polyangiaceae bacterium]